MRALARAPAKLPGTWGTDEWRKEPPAELFRLKVRALWAFFLKQPLSFWLICAYAFFEYVRPQAIYPAIKGMPFAFWTIILCALAFTLEGLKLRRLTTLDGMLLGFTLIVVASSLSAYWPSWSFQRIMEVYLGWVIIYFLISNTVDNEKKFLVFMLLYFVWCLKMSQFGTRAMIMRGFAFSSYGLTCAPQFFHNSGECGIQLAMFFGSSLYFFLGVAAYLGRGTKLVIALMPITAGVAIMGSSSRGAQLALAAVFLWMVLRSRTPIRTLIFAGVMGAALFAILPEEQKDRFREMGTDDTSLTRRQYWRDGIRIMQEHPYLGVGFQNWLPYYKTRYNPGGQLPHNIFVEAGAELGYTGLAGFVVLIIGTLVFNVRTRRMAKRIPRGNFLWCMAHGLDGALIAFIVGGYFVTVLYYPFFWINLAMTASLYNVTQKRLRAANAEAAALRQVPVHAPLGEHAS
jgi:putative inorganic carbon (hco3(-)) transporter